MADHQIDLARLHPLWFLLSETVQRHLSVARHNKRPRPQAQLKMAPSQAVDLVAFAGAAVAVAHGKLLKAPSSGYENVF